MRFSDHRRLAARGPQAAGNGSDIASGGSRGGTAGHAGWWWSKLRASVLGRRAAAADLFLHAHALPDSLGNASLPARSPDSGGAPRPAAATPGALLALIMNADVFASPAALQSLARLGRAHGGSSRGGGGGGWMEGRAFALLRWEWIWPAPVAGPLSPPGAAMAAALRDPPWSPIFAAGARGVLAPRADSQDAWVVRAPLPRRVVAALEATGRGDGARLFLGMPRCDNRLAEVLASGGLTVTNPALHLPTYHVHAGASPMASSPSPSPWGDGGTAGGTGAQLGGYLGALEAHGAGRLVPLSLDWGHDLQ